jgi:DNA-binding NarL/FixJ family response regulator
MKKSLFIIDDHKVVRDGIRAILLGKPDIEIVGEAGSAEEARRKLSALQPAIIFFDIKLPDENGVDLLIEIMQDHPKAHCGILTSDPNSQDLLRAKHHGAIAFLTKDIDAHEYFIALDRIVKGEKYISAAFAEVLMEKKADYTPKEIEVLKGFADGLTYKEIGARMDISTRTVETHKNNLLNKMKVKSIVEMVRIGIREGIITA